MREEKDLGDGSGRPSPCAEDSAPELWPEQIRFTSAMSRVEGYATGAVSCMAYLGIVNLQGVRLVIQHIRQELIKAEASLSILEARSALEASSPEGPK